MLGECNQEEKGRVEAWITSDSARAKEFEKLRLLWEESRKISSQSTVNADEAWERFTKLRDKKDRGDLPAKVVSLPTAGKRWLAIAAGVIIVLGVSMLLKWMLNPPEPVQVAMLKIQSDQGTITDTLPDGSVITLNKNSTVEYPAVFSDSVRQVKMEGEVFFDVAKNPSKPFIINTSMADIKVVGTSFNVKNKQGSTEVIVETGVVEVSNKLQKVALTAGKMVKVTEGDSALQAQNTSGTLYQYFRNRQFVCDNTPLFELAAILSEAYSVNIVIEKTAIKNLRISTTFSDESLESILMIIEQTMGVKAIQNGDSILIQ